MICVSCWMPLRVMKWLMHTASHLKLIFIPFPWQLILITIKIAPHHSSIFLSLKPPFPLFSWPSTISYSDATKKIIKKEESRSHFINCSCLPRHISSLKHLDIFVVEHFFPSAGEICYSLCLCVRAQRLYKVCVCAYAPDWYLMCMTVMHNPVNWRSMRTGLSMDQ